MVPPETSSGVATSGWQVVRGHSLLINKNALINCHTLNFSGRMKIGKLKRALRTSHVDFWIWKNVITLRTAAPRNQNWEATVSAMLCLCHPAVSTLPVRIAHCPWRHVSSFLSVCRNTLYTCSATDSGLLHSSKSQDMCRVSFWTTLRKCGEHHFNHGSGTSKKCNTMPLTHFSRIYRWIFLVHSIAKSPWCCAMNGAHYHNADNPN